MKYASIQNIENGYFGIRANIIKRKDGKYVVSLTDMDSGETLPTLKIFKEYEPAYKYANKIAGV